MINNKKYLIDGDGSTGFFGKAVPIDGVDRIGFQFSWDGDLTGTLEMDISFDGLLWTKVDPTKMITSGEDPAGVPGNAIIEFETTAAFARGRYEATTGTGLVQIHVVGKGWQ